MTPHPKPMASHGTSRPTAISAASHWRTCAAARRAGSVRASGHAHGGWAGAAADGGRHVELRPPPDRVRHSSGPAIVAALPATVGPPETGPAFGRPDETLRVIRPPRQAADYGRAKHTA